MKYFLILIASCLFLSCAQYENEFDRVLTAAQAGELFNQVGKEKYISNDLTDYFTHPHESDSGRIEDNIYIPQYFESYKFVKSKDTGLKEVHRTIALDNFGEKGSDSRDRIKNIFLKKDSAKLEGDIIKYIDRKAKTKEVEFILKNGNERFRLQLYCLQSDIGWKIYRALYKKIEI